MRVTVHVGELLSRIGTNPFRVPVWGTGTRLTHLAIARALQCSVRETIPWSSYAWQELASRPEPYDHAARVAALIERADATPIELEIIHVDGTLVLHNGHHRLAAAIFCNDLTIEADVGGYIDCVPRALMAPDKRLWDSENVRSDWTGCGENVTL